MATIEQEMMDSRKAAEAIAGGPGDGWSGGFTPKYSDLPKNHRRAVDEVAKTYGVGADGIAAWYESEDGRRIVGAHYKGIPMGGRVRRNTSRTQDGSEALTDRMHRAIYRGNSGKQELPNLNYSIPYDITKEVRIDDVGRAPLNALDSLAKYAAVTGISLQEALGLAAQETGMGALPYENIASEKGKTGEELQKIREYNNQLANGNYFREFGAIPAEYIVRDFEYNRAGHSVDRSIPPLQHAFEYYKAGKYNPGDKNHTNDVLEKGKKVLGSKSVQDWLKSSPYAKGVAVWRKDRKD